jgi:prepilin-type N-terminal cleavage/methylation domain-containing protein
MSFSMRPSSVGARCSRGFTLLEIMVAVALLGLVLVTLLGLKNRTMQDVMLADHITTATLLAKREMTELLQNRASRPQESEIEDKFEEEEFSDYTWKKTFTPLMIDTPNGPIKITEIKVAVLWQEGNRQESVELVSYE